ncbi:MAG: orotidine-5'-phosphate decarboxylase [Bacteroidales bacterium]|jgi:orotidine-5'-phosphate decarboxylase|nr:orotidine-5'-phosphate decarboxylase [Bacteroidales bacterium]
MIVDELFEKVAANGHVCVGLDTDYSYLPASFAAQYNTVDEALFAFNSQLIEATFDVAACFKVQIAYYEACGIAGMEAYRRTMQLLRAKGAIAIADVKRGDIAKTAEMYAKAHFEGDFESDFITLNPYMGLDSLQPYLPYVREKNKGLFVLIRTSNEGAKDIEYLPLAQNRCVYHEVGERINALGKNYLGTCGFSAVGGVMGCTHADEAQEMRNTLDSTFFLIPGYGAQGGKAEDIALYLKGGNGGVVNASRSILLAYKKIENGEIYFAECARNEVLRMRAELWQAIRH